MVQFLADIQLSLNRKVAALKTELDTTSDVVALEAGR